MFIADQMRIDAGRIDTSDHLIAGVMKRVRTCHTCLINRSRAIRKPFSMILWRGQIPALQNAGIVEPFGRFGKLLIPRHGEVFGVLQF